MVYGAGGYKFMDFFKFGGPLQVIPRRQQQLPCTGLSCYFVTDVSSDAPCPCWC
jgi:hypothetical protein